MERDSRITQIQELATWFTNSNSDELPNRLMYVYYCDICSSVLALRATLEFPQSFFYTTMDKCPTCHFELETSLRCQALIGRVPFTSRKSRAYNTQQVAWPKRSRLSFGHNLLDETCGGVYSGQLTVLYGENICQSIALGLCVRSQLPVDSGGFDAQSVFIDGGNSFDVYHATDYARILRSDRDEVLRRIKVSRAFTCYQLTNLILEKLPELLCEEKVGLVAVASLLGMFLDPDVESKEAKQTVNFLSVFLARFARENNVAVVVTCPTSKNNSETPLLRSLTSRAQVVLKAELTKQAPTFILEKHPDRSCPMRITDRAEELKVEYELRHFFPRTD